MSSPLWFSIEINLASDTTQKIFSGYFFTDANDVVNGCYETINNKTDYTKNLVVPLSNPSALRYDKLVANTGLGARYDNGYKEGWFQFDTNGLLLTNISYYGSDANIRLLSSIGFESETTRGSLFKYVNNENVDSSIVVYTINKVSDPTNLTYWYSIGLNLKDTQENVFNGFFKTNQTNDVTGFYETVNGKTDFNDNLLSDLILVEPGVASNGFQCYNGTNVTGKQIFRINNGYESNWLQFDGPGVLIKKMSYYKDSSLINLCADQWGDETLTNVGDILVYVEKTDETNTILAAFTIKPISDPTCFNEGTKILCLNKNFEEEYVAIENLKKGDLVKSYKHGYRKIDLIGKNTLVNNPIKFSECMYKMEKTDENGLLEDLIVTGGHAVLVDDLGDHAEENNKIFGETPKIDGKHLLLSCVSKDFTKIEDTQVFTYYHLTLENNGDDEERFGIWANGVLTETPSNKLFASSEITLI